jgi:RNA polymerase sigma-70 factor (ECF subfamily)
MLRPNIDGGALSAMAGLPDEALLKKISQHHQPALNELYGRYGRTLKAVIESVVHEEAEADDVLQEIFLQIWKEATNYSPKAGKPLGWVVTIARRRAIDRLRRRQAYCRARDRYSEELDSKTQRPRRRDAEKTFVMADMRQFLQRRMRSLPKNQREAIDLAFFKGLSHREIATATRTPLGTVKTRLELGLQKLTQSIRPLRNKI